MRRLEVAAWRILRTAGGRARRAGSARGVASRLSNAALLPRDRGQTCSHPAGHIFLCPFTSSDKGLGSLALSLEVPPPPCKRESFAFTNIYMYKFFFFSKFHRFLLFPVLTVFLF